VTAGERPVARAKSNLIRVCRAAVVWIPIVAAPALAQNAQPGASSMPPPPDASAAPPPGALPSGAPGEAGRQRYMPAVASQAVKLRAGPGTTYDVVANIPAGSTVGVGQCTGAWCAVVWQGHRGFAIEKALAKGPSGRYGRYPPGGSPDGPYYDYDAGPDYGPGYYPGYWGPGYWGPGYWGPGWGCCWGGGWGHGGWHGHR